MAVEDTVNKALEVDRDNMMLVVVELLHKGIVVASLLVEVVEFVVGEFVAVVFVVAAFVVGVFVVAAFVAEVLVIFD